MSDYPEPSFHELYETAYQIVSGIDAFDFLVLRRDSGLPQVAEVADFLAELTVLMQHFHTELVSAQDSPLERQINASRQHKPVELFGVHTNALRAVFRLAKDVLFAATGRWTPPTRNLDKASLQEAYCDLLRGLSGVGDNSRKWKAHCKRLMATLSAIHFQRIQTTLSLEMAAAELFLKEHQTNAGASGKPAGDDASQTGEEPPAHGAVVLRGQADGPFVHGKEKEKLTFHQYNVVKAILDAGGNGLTKDELVDRSGHTDALGILHRLADKDADWKRAIHFAGIPGGRYRIG